MPDTSRIPVEVVRAAVRAAERLGRDVADVPVLAIAQEAGVSRSTLLRRIGGSRPALDEAVRAAGVDPGGQRPVRDRAIEAGARLIEENGLAAFTLESVAASARCSVHSLYGAFGGRDDLLHAIFETYSPILDVEKVISEPHTGLAGKVTAIYRLLAEAFDREPRVLPAMFAEALARPRAPALQSLQRYFVLRMLAGLGRWLAEEMDAGRVRVLPVPLVMQQMIGPVLLHFMTRPVIRQIPGLDLPAAQEVCAVFAEAFLHAVVVDDADAPDDPDEPDAVDAVDDADAPDEAGRA